MNWYKKLFALGLTTISIVLSSCGSIEADETTTSGVLKVAVDENFKRMFEAQKYTFEAVYPKSKIEVIYCSEAKAMELLLNDSVQVIMINRDLKESEKAVLSKTKHMPFSQKIAEDAMVLIENKENTDTVIRLNRFTQMLMGKDSLWNWAEGDKAVKIVFDGKDAVNARHLNDSITKGAKFPPYCYSLKNYEEVIEYVKKNKSALGLISASNISDNDDSAVVNVINSIRIVSMSKGDTGAVFGPYQSYIKTKEYPICRDVYLISRQKGGYLNHGFMSFVWSQQGQLIILKQGMVPAETPHRVIQFNAE